MPVDKKISQLPNITPLDGSESLAFVQDSETRQGTVNDIITLFDGSDYLRLDGTNEMVGPIIFNGSFPQIDVVTGGSPNTGDNVVIGQDNAQGVTIGPTTGAFISINTLTEIVQMQDPVGDSVILYAGGVYIANSTSDGFEIIGNIISEKINGNVVSQTTATKIKVLVPVQMNNNFKYWKGDPDSPITGDLREGYNSGSIELQEYDGVVWNLRSSR